MHRNSLIETAGRVMHQAVRFTLNQGNDNPMMQELHLDGMNSEFRSVVERVQAFGFTSTPLPRDQQQGQQSQSSSNGGIEGTEQPKGPAAEGICLFLGGQRNHPVCIAIDDRRHRPMGLKPGENAQYDDIGQMTLLRRTGTYILSLDDQQQSSSGSSRDSSSGSSGQAQTRMVSLRHVQKQKQQRPGQSGGSGSSGGGASAGTLDSSSGSGTSQQDFQHEGQTVNTEVRCTAGNVQILDGTTVVANYDKSSGTWSFTSKVINLTASSTMTLKSSGALNIQGSPINFNGGGPSTPPFTVPG